MTHFLQLELPDSDVDAELLSHALERRLQARAARADAAVEITPELVSTWAKEELSTLVTELREMRRRAGQRVLN